MAKSKAPAGTPTPDDPSSVVDKVGQSAPVDCAKPYDASTLVGKTILITGGASGFGAAFARHWARHGAHIVLGDINDGAGEALAAELRAASSSSFPGQHISYQHCDVTSWADQVALFQAALASSPTRRLDAVVAGAGIVDPANQFEQPRSSSSSSNGNSSNSDKQHHTTAPLPPPPAPPALNVLAVNLTGVMYTSHLALYYLALKDPSSTSTSTSSSSTTTSTRDRHLLLVSSIAGLIGLPGQPEYTASKHAVMGLFRALRGTSRATRGVRVNALCPYFVDTPLLGRGGRALLAGMPAARLEDVVDAATRLVADDGIVGRALVVGPAMEVVDGGDDLDGSGGGGGKEEEWDDDDGGLGLAERVARGERGAGSGSSTRRQAVWEVYGHDFERVETFVWRYLALLNALKAATGWLGTVRDLLRIFVGGGRR